MKTQIHCLAAILGALAVFPVTAADYASTVLNLKPIAYYRLGETTPVSADTAANLGLAGVVGTAFYINEPWHQAPGALAGSTDGAAGLNGANQRVATPYDASINPTGPFTAEAWVNPDSMQEGASVVCPLAFWSQPSGRTGWLIYQGSAGWNLRMYDGVTTGQVVDITGGGAPSVGTWYHLAVVYDGVKAAFYVNGVLAGEKSAAAYVPNANGLFSIGARSDGNFWFPGYVDEVAIYAAALSATELRMHYQNGTSSSPSPAYETLILAQNPLLYYRLNEPAFTPGETVTAANLGSLGAWADGVYEAGALTGVPGPPFAGFGAGNTGMRISSLAGDVLIQEQYLETATFTITCWFKRSGAHAAGQALVFTRRADQGLATGLGFGYNGSPGVDQLNVHWNEGPSSWLTGLTPPDDVWCFAAAVYEPTKVTVYLNQTSNSLNTTIGTHDFSVAPIYIGWDFPYPRFNGSLDEVALFDRALAPAEIQTLLESSQMTPQFLAFTRTPADPLFEGYAITMTAAVGGIPPFTYQWQKDGVPLAGQTTATLSIPNAAVADSGDYTLVASNAYGSTTSPVQALRITSGPPRVLAQSIFNATRAIGGWVNYSVTAGGSAPISHQWKKGAAPIAGATDSVLKLRNLQPSDAGDYSVTLTNPYGATNTTAGTVSVFTVTNYPYAAMYGNPLAYYRLNEAGGTTAADIAGGLNGTVNGAVVPGVPGPQAPDWASLESTNTSFEFSASSTRVQLPSFNLKTNQITIVAWINPYGPQKDQTGILASRTPAGLAGFFINYQNSDALSYVWEGTDSWWQFKSGLVPAVGQWNFVALVIEPAQGTVYLDDGTGIRSATYLPSQGHKTVPWDSPNIGVDLGYDRWFYGGIDEVVVYDRALSPAEVANLDLLGKSWPGPPPQLLEQPESVAVYVGQPVRFTVNAIGALPVLYQWRLAGVNLPGATRPVFELPEAYFTDAGAYDVAVSNPVGTNLSQTAVLTVAPLPTFANLTNELVAHLKFDGDYQDSSGRDNHGAPMGNPAFTAGRIGTGALHYSTVVVDSEVTEANYVTLGTPADLEFGGATSFSVAFWIKFTGTPGDLPFLCNNYNSYGGPGFVFAPSWETGSWSWSLNDGLSPVNWPGVAAQYGHDAGYANTLNDGQWHHLVHVVDRAGDVTTFVDGVKVHAKPIAGLAFDVNTYTETNIGQGTSGLYEVAGDFEMDDLGIWRRALTAVEAQSIYLVAQNGATFDTYGPVWLSIRRAGDALELVWQAGTLQSAAAVGGAYTPVPGASAPYHRVTPGATPMFYRVKL
ncbi:MAG TPA: immunoglobulin domain-containing protein [Verrucomicrobiota bacterium]|nr:immunoglobulin domain-containing protein [Verrucomicrobiota bacterium]HNU49282.1 immunoglobulin domain-containing protein [Verrucomicrobiota bacterium]